MIQFHSTVLFVEDIETSKKFYTEILGCEIKEDFGTNVSLACGISLWQIAEEHVIPTTLGRESVFGPSNRQELYFEAIDLPSVEKRLLDTDVAFLHRLHEEPWGQQTIRFFDPDGHLIEVGEPLEAFLQRFFDSGMSLEEIEAKTSVPVRDIRKILEIL